MKNGSVVMKAGGGKYYRVTGTGRNAFGVRGVSLIQIEYDGIANAWRSVCDGEAFNIHVNDMRGVYLSVAATVEVVAGGLLVTTTTTEDGMGKKSVKMPSYAELMGEVVE